MIKSVLFDLDGTLLHLEQEDFMREYLKHLSGSIAHLVDPRRFVNELLASTEVMVRNRDCHRTNQQVFFDDFIPRIGLPRETLMPAIDDFYEHNFHAVRKVTRADAAAQRAVQVVLDHGRTAVVATNPVFPMTATRQRLGWAGLADVPFALVTSYEQSHFCKPNPEYYREVADKIACDPHECLMIGNDVGEDLIAASIGMRTCLVTDHLIHNQPNEPQADVIAQLANLPEVLAQLLES